MKKKKQVLLTIGSLILQSIRDIGIGTIDSFFPRKYPEARMWRGLLGLDPSYEFTPHRFSKILSKLQRQGFVQRIGTKQHAQWQLTSKGKAKLASDHAKDPLVTPDGIQRIVIFDIPEKEGKKRRWLRTQLLSFEYSQLQKSVWIGEVPLPKKFINDLDTLHLGQYIHIFSVEKSGSLSH